MSSALGTLRRDFGGGIIEPGSAEYESASRSLLASGNPAYVLRPTASGTCKPVSDSLPGQGFCYPCEAAAMAFRASARMTAAS